MTMNSDDIFKLEIVKDYTPSELMTIIIYLEGGMFCDRFGQPYTREHIKKISGKFVDTLADEESDTLLTERPRINYCTQDEADLWSGRANASDGLSEPLGGIPDEEEF